MVAFVAWEAMASLEMPLTGECMPGPRLPTPSHSGLVKAYEEVPKTEAGVWSREMPACGTTLQAGRGLPVWAVKIRGDAKGPEPESGGEAVSTGQSQGPGAATEEPTLVTDTCRLIRDAQCPT